MKAFLEITVWDCEYAVPNHVYFLNDSKDKMYGYVQSGTNEPKEMSSPYRFKTSGRKFQEVANTWGFRPRAEPVPTGETHRVAGSRGSVYTVTNQNGAWSCTCPAAKWQSGACKHVKQLAVQ